LAELAESELLVAGGRLAACRVPAADLAEEEAQHGGLQLVEPRVVADRLEVLLVTRAVEAKQRDPVGELLVGRRDKASIAEREQVLGREEAEGRERSHLRDALGAVGLRGVLEDRD